MKAIVYRQNGPPDVLTCEEIERPSPGDGEVLIKVRAAAVNPLDCHLLKGGPTLLRLLLGSQKLKRVGVDAAGVVDAVGPGVTHSSSEIVSLGLAAALSPNTRLRQCLP